MSEKALKKSCKIIVVDGASQSRMTIQKGLKAAGFTNSSGLANFQGLMERLEADPVDWVLVHMNREDIPSGLQLLQLRLKEPTLHKMMVSTFVDGKDLELMYTGYSLGMLSHHGKKFTKDLVVDDFKKFGKFWEKWKGDPTLIAYEYISELLYSDGKKVERAGLVEELVRLNPGNARLLLELGSAQAKIKKFDEAHSSLSQAVLIDPKLEEAAVGIRKEVPELANKGDTKQNLGLKTVMVVDQDEIETHKIKEILAKFGCEKIECFIDGETAAKWMEKNSEPDLLLMEWKLPKLNGPIFVQRVRQCGFENVPIIVVSALVKDNDRSIMGEMGVANVITKPFEEVAFSSAVIWTVKQELSPTELSIFERKILAALANKDSKSVQALKEKLEKLPAATPAYMKYIEAEIAFAKGDFDSAKRAGLTALKNGQQNVRVFNLMGKVFMKLHEFDMASKCMERAQTMSPMNLMRLCAMVEVQSEQGQDGIATKTIEKLKDLDPRNKQVEITEANFHLTRGDLKKANKIMSKMPNLKEVLGYLNNRGVTLARTGKVEEAMELYDRALKAIPDDRKDIIAIVYYNMALGLARNDDLDGAMKKLEPAISMGSARIKAKGESLKKRIDKANKSGEPFELVSAKKHKKKKGEDIDLSATMESIVTVSAGQLACYLIFDTGNVSSEIVSLLKETPSFTVRSSVKREESLGAERALKRAS